MNPEEDDPLSPEDGAVLEQQLRALPVPSLPPEWRDAILAKAARPPWPWLPRPVKWALAACWTATGVIHLATPAAPGPLPAGWAARPPAPPPVLDPQWLASHELSPPDQAEIPVP